ncbi:hypothetical protein M8C21_021759, partial [Ambrosia artemisiifolia]
HPTGQDIKHDYNLVRELGRGEFGITYLCTDLKTGEKLGCKSISKKKLRTAVDVEDVRREVEIMKQLPKHPNVVTLRDTYEEDEAVHIVMELCEGGELFDRIVARGHYTERAAASIMRTIVEVVQATNVPLGEIVKSRLKQFSVMNKLKKQALRDGRISYEEFVIMMRTGTDWRKASRQYSRERFNNLSLKLMNDGSLELTSSNR